MQRCFSYCAVFPKDFDIDVDKLIRMWMAQGFLSTSTGEMEEMGRRIFDDLSQHSFFQEFKKVDSFGERVVSCTMHDIVHDFAQYLTKNECTVMEEIGDENSKRDSFQTARHLSWLERQETDNLKTLVSSSIPNVEQLRTFLCMYNAPSSFLKHLKRVRVLSLSNCSLHMIPEELGNMIHLKYLDLSNNIFDCYADVICDLQNLETLDLSGHSSCLLPHGIHKLVNLRHLSMREVKLSQGLGRLTNLRTLKGTIKITKGDNNLGCLKDLNQLEGELTISLSGLNEDADVDEAKKAKLIRKRFIHTFTLMYDDKVRLEVVEALQPNAELLCLDITGCELPNWLTVMENLRKLVLSGSSKLPHLWKLQFLEELYISRSDAQYLGLNFLGLKCHDASSSRSDVIYVKEDTHAVAYPSLKTLSFSNWKKWIEWEDISDEEEANRNLEIMPCLTHLTLYRCNELKMLPHRFLMRVKSSLQTLKITNCSQLKTCYEAGGDFEKK